MAAGGTNVALSGSYTVGGGCGNGDRGTVLGATLPSYTNTYSGSLIFGPNHSSVPMSMAITQTGPNSDGFYQVTGSATLTGSPCFSTATISSSYIAGNYIEITLTPNNGGEVDFIGEVSTSTGNTISGISGNYVVNAGKCAGDFGTGSVSAGN